MNILLVCYCYPPDVGPRAFRWSAVAERWAADGHRVDVVCAWRPGSPREEAVGGVRVHRVGGGLIETLRHRLRRRTDGSLASAAGFTGPAAALKWLYDRTWKKIYWPDSACLWFFPAWAKARALLAGGAYDAAISTSTPYTGHLVGHRIKARRRGIRWLVDIGDPFSLYEELPWNNVGLYAGLNRRSERAVLADADAVSVTVQACLDAYARAFPGIERKGRVIPPIFAGVPVRGQAAATPARAGGRRLVFIGTLYRAIRNPDYLLRLFAAVAERRGDVEMHVFGRVNDCVESFAPYRERLADRLFVHGPVAHDVALAEAAAADVLVNIGNTTADQLPSKVIEYAATGKPILNIVRRRDDTSVAVLADYPAAETVFETDGGPRAGDVDAVLKLIEAPPVVSPAALDAFLDPFRVETAAREYLALLTDATSGTTPAEAAQ